MRRDTCPICWRYTLVHTRDHYRDVCRDCAALAQESPD